MRFKNSWLEGVVTEMTPVGDNVLQIKIQGSDGTRPYTVGSHIDMQVLINGLPEIRSYSLIGKFDPAEPYTISVKRLASSRGGSKYMWGLEKGNRIKISVPQNHFELSFTADQYLLLAGGIGITPLVGMAEELKAKNKQVTMIYIGREESEMAYIPRLKKVLGDNLILHYSNTDGKYDLKQYLNYVSATSLIYLCGPLGLMNAVRQAWEESGYENANLRFETFGASGLFAPQKFMVKIPRFNKEIEVTENQSILQALNAAKVDVMYDCQKGECGLCQVDVIAYSGDIDHRDCFFSEEEKGENKKICACVSRVANGHIVIDTAYRG